MEKNYEHHLKKNKDAYCGKILGVKTPSKSSNPTINNNLESLRSMKSLVDINDESKLLTVNQNLSQLFANADDSSQLLTQKNFILLRLVKEFQQKYNDQLVEERKIHNSLITENKRMLINYNKLCQNYDFLMDFYNSHATGREELQLQELLSVYRQSTKHLIATYLQTFKFIYNSIAGKKFRTKTFYEIKDLMLESIGNIKRIADEHQFEDYFPDLEKIFWNFKLIKSLKYSVMHPSIFFEKLNTFDKADLIKKDNRPLKSKDTDSFLKRHQYADNLNNDRLRTKSVQRERETHHNPEISMFSENTIEDNRTLQGILKKEMHTSKSLSINNDFDRNESRLRSCSNMQRSEDYDTKMKSQLNLDMLRKIDYKQDDQRNPRDDSVSSNSLHNKENLITNSRYNMEQVQRNANELNGTRSGAMQGKSNNTTRSYKINNQKAMMIEDSDTNEKYFKPNTDLNESTKWVDTNDYRRDNILISDFNGRQNVTNHSLIKSGDVSKRCYSPSRRSPNEKSDNDLIESLDEQNRKDRIYNEIKNINNYEQTKKVLIGLLKEDYQNPKNSHLNFKANEEVFILEEYEDYYYVEKGCGLQGFVPKTKIIF